MSMTPEQQRALAVKCGAIEGTYVRGDGTATEEFTFLTEELAAYTAAVEAKERERCAVVCEQSDRYRGEYFAELIRGLK